ncbi:PEPxxWA-CTERM sorting domain-containing protein [Phenylobacterium sp.]|uniref:PEPxxWA-CTERM sorting domain-containing protein n=1 Tax=Phenylobacterium sp. TaxID=1871053 RepID=UPI0025EC252C|nr:PEPxxWA-CTERM sorting domain-containing protein [Phenylobacterium sp.]
MRKRIAMAALAGAAVVSTAAEAETIYFQNFDNGLTAQERVGGTFGAANGSVGHTGLIYPNFDNSYYQVSLDLRNYTDALLTFDYDLVTEEHYDGFNVQASTDGVFGASKVIRSMTNNFYGTMFNNLSDLGRVAVTGSQRGTTQFDLSQFAGQTLDLRFQFQADYSAFSRGLLLDNVAITGTRAPGTTVPEPAAWALMILGFGAAGSALRRRRALAI